jgi:nitric oxide reductase NorD protein
MATHPRLTQEEIESLLEDYLEVEFSFRNTALPARALARLTPTEQGFVLDWVRRVASTHIEVAYQFALRAPQALSVMETRTIEAWALHAMDCYDRSGLRPALGVIADVERFIQHGGQRTAGAMLEEEAGVLLPFVHALSGRKLKLEEADGYAYTDSETIFLPPVIGRFPNPRDNFRLYKVMVAHHWAQAYFGTFTADLRAALAGYHDFDRALRWFHALETVRLDACIQRELPGLFRELRGLQHALGESPTAATWGSSLVDGLQRPGAGVADTLEWVERVYHHPEPARVCYQGRLDPDAVTRVRERRLQREKAWFRVVLRQIAEELTDEPSAGTRPPERFGVRQNVMEDPADDLPHLAITLGDKPIAVPPQVQELMTSIVQDLERIPDSYLEPAGPGEYDLRQFDEAKLDPEQVWQGAYHEEGASLYREWDFRRRHYRKNWCVVRERQVSPVYDDFSAKTEDKYRGVIKHLRRTFEAMADEERRLKRQTFGDSVDIDALVEAWADVRAGLEMTDRLFTRLHRQERNIAAVLMVDISGSTKGWINQAEREALILLCEALEALGDRYAIYGFSGNTRKRCEVYPVKSFAEPFDEHIKARISGLRPQDYTRMGAAIRHLSQLLTGIEARTKLLITLSDGKPEDYDGYYLGEYGVEDTRQALFEARQQDIHAFCITIDETARDYLPHMYGAANYLVIREVADLPYKMADIYRRLTS